MISSAVLMGLGLMAAAPTTISEVDAVREGGRLAITIKSDAMIDPEAASAKLADGRLYLFVRDAHVHEANRAWGEGAAEIRAHRHRHEVELVVPLGDGPCQGSVEFAESPAGLRAFVGCDEKAVPRIPAPARAAATAVRATPEPKTEAKTETKIEAKIEAKAEPKPLAAAPEPKTDAKPVSAKLDVAKPHAKPVAVVASATEQAVALKAALVLQPPSKGAANKGEEKPVAAPVTRATQPPPALAATTASPDLSAPAAGKGADAAAGKSSSGGGAGMLLAGVLLAALAAAAFHFTRRRARSSRYIEILESASLGPKRSIVVARVGDATMILGTSEAGITLLKALPEPDAERPATAPAGRPATLSSELAAVADVIAIKPAAGGEERESPRAARDSGVAPAKPELDDDDVPVDDLSLEDPAPGRRVGLVARFFRRGEHIGEPDADSFDDLLEDSLEDQELRRKLSLGMAGRVR